ncbi:hypothetical protein FACS1894152_3230 [Bacilli bacterium]|nr:hypothetical protein FACS1894152_3230 [Bacilli bacterium]
MKNNKLLIDAAFPEEIRVAVLNERNVLENIDMETTSIKQLKGNVYVAKIIRLEPSLQAAFINYGGDRHGFLPMSDIHPDYYNIPEDRKNDLSAVRFFSALGSGKQFDSDDEDEGEPSEDDFADENLVELNENGEPISHKDESENTNDTNPEIIDESDDGASGDIKSEEYYVGQSGYKSEEIMDEEVVERGRSNDFRRYKIENVLKEGQSILVQVLKEERGNKGVALTTYISLAGKYSVLMANIEGKGGISKKIINIRDRKILKNILNTINPDNSKSVIIRTAGVGKKPEEISRDYVYILRLWDAIKQVSTSSEAPIFIHSEDDILKRTIRDLYNDRISEIVVEGAAAYENIKSLVKVITPDQRITVRNYTDRVPIFYRYRVEEQIEQLYNNRVELPSGGSIVIDQTEALVAIDVNSGKSTREKSVEETALATNIEAAREIARQLRLRNIGGLLVIDFIDMYENRNRRTIERVLREETILDKAKTQIDRISIFGLMEVSRQRVQAGLYESVSEKCPKCDGHGTIRSKYIMVNNILRSLKISSRERAVRVVEVFVNTAIANFMLNYKRNEIIEIEKNYEITVIISINDNLDNKYEIKRRSFLSDEEKINLCPNQQQLGKVNTTFEDDVLYDTSDSDVSQHFADNCYYSKTPADKFERNPDRFDKNPEKFARPERSTDRSFDKNAPRDMTSRKSTTRPPQQRQQNNPPPPRYRQPEVVQQEEKKSGFFSRVKDFFGVE